MSTKLVVHGTKVDVVNGWVSVSALCKALKIDVPRQREKAKRTFKTKMIKVAVQEPSRKVFYAQVCIKYQDALSFIASKGLWTKGPYKKN